MVTFSAFIPIVTGRGVEDVLASDAGVAAVVGARIPIVAGLGLAHTVALVAMVVGGAQVQIVARGLVEGVLATRNGVADVIGTHVVIIAVELGPLTFALDALVVEGAHTAVITAGIDRLMLTAAHEVAEVDGTRAVVVTIHRLSLTQSVLADVILRARVLVRAGTIVGFVDAGTGVDVAVVQGTGVPVVADVDFIDAAWVSRQRIGAPHRRVADICSAIVEIVATGRLVSGDALGLSADVADGASIVVVAGLSIQLHVEAALPRLAGIRGAGVVVVARRPRAAQAFPRLTEIQGRAGVSVVAGHVENRMLAAEIGGTEVLCAGIAIVAESLFASALPVDTDVVDRAGVVIIAGGKGLAGPHVGIFCGMTEETLVVGVLLTRFGADAVDEAFADDKGVGAIAQAVAGVQSAFPAVVAFIGLAHAFLALAHVENGAGIAVIARHAVLAGEGGEIGDDLQDIGRILDLDFPDLHLVTQGVGVLEKLEVRRDHHVHKVQWQQVNGAPLVARVQVVCRGHLVGPVPDLLNRLKVADREQVQGIQSFHRGTGAGGEQQQGDNGSSIHGPTP
jgi:hypothetical protein